VPDPYHRIDRSFLHRRREQLDIPRKRSGARTWVTQPRPRPSPTSRPAQQGVTSRTRTNRKGRSYPLQSSTLESMRSARGLFDPREIVEVPPTGQDDNPMTFWPLRGGASVRFSGQRSGARRQSSKLKPEDQAMRLLDWAGVPVPRDHGRRDLWKSRYTITGRP